VFEAIKYHLSVVSCLARISVRRQLDWILTFISFVIALPVRCATGLVLIYVLVDKFSPLYGWSYNQLVFMYGLAYISGGLVMTFGSQARRFESYVIRGEFDRYLVRPISVLFHIIFKQIFLGGIAETIAGFIVFIYGCHLVGFVASVANIFQIVLVIIGATLIRIAFLIISSSVAFWTKRSEPLIWVQDGIAWHTTQYPLSIYPGFIQALFTFILPFGFISFYPSGAFFGFSSSFNLPLNLVIWTPCIGIIMIVIANQVFTWGLKKYESSGV
jgi:ABC-2 type transport system permease protein